MALGLAVGVARAQTPAQWAVRGDTLLAQGDLRDAEAAYKRVLQTGDRSAQAEAYVGLGRIALQQEDWGDAADRFGEALERSPDDLDAHYYRAIAYREMARIRTLMQFRHWPASARHFEAVLARDSSFRDVLYQYALLRRYHEAYPEAIGLGEAQLRLHPALREAHLGLFRIYRSFVRHTATDKALAWLESRPSPHARYFAGEALRRAGRLDAADTLFADLLRDAAELPPQPVLLSRARIAYARHQKERGQAFVEAAIERIQSPLEADLVFEDVKYIVDPEELTEFRSLHDPAAFKAFFRALWARRNPFPSSPLDWRMAEHYRRLLTAEADYAYDGPRFWHTNPDKLNELDLPPTHALNDDLNDIGLIYVRHGEPDDEIYVIGGPNVGVDEFYRSWRYNGERLLDFHFLRAGTGNNWRLTPVLWEVGGDARTEILESREEWGGLYARLASLAREAQRAREPIRERLEYNDLAGDLTQRARADAAQGLTTDRHTWSDDVEQTPMPYVAAAFEGEDGGTDVVIYYALPIGAVSERAGIDVGAVDIELGHAVYDTTWRAVAHEAQVKRMPASPDASTALIDFFNFTVAPDSYHVAIHYRPTRTNQIGGATFDYRVPDFGAPGGAMSDVVLADFVGRADVGSRFNRGDVHVSPNPFLRFAKQQPFYVYFELYRLARRDDGTTDYTVEYVLKPLRRKPKFLGLFGGGDRPSLTLRSDHAGTDPSPVEYTEIDASNVDAGPYELTVRITDNVTGTILERSRPLELGE